MFCTNCGVELREADRFCSQCGKGTGAGPAWSQRRLALPLEGKKLLGVCAGFARYFEVDVTLMRIIWLVGSIATGGIGFLGYLIAWLLMPKDQPAAAPPSYQTSAARPA
jgi:phage shock protein PspC (stress-responsive transcriptional regulator)